MATHAGGGATAKKKPSVGNPKGPLKAFKPSVGRGGASSKKK